MARLFGFSIEDSNEKVNPTVVSPVPPNNADGSDFYLTSGFFGSYVDIEGVYRTEFDLIKRYREMALHPECDSAIEDIVNEAIVSDTNDSPIAIELSNLNASDGIKRKIREEFKYILELLDFDKKSHEIYRNWYIDGRLYYHKVIDFKNPNLGIQELRYIDAMKMRYVRQEKETDESRRQKRLANVGSSNPMEYEFPKIEEYYVYNPKMSFPTTNPSSLGGTGGIKFTKDAITYCHSGLIDRNKGSTLSYLHKAIKSLNQLRMIEDSLVIYRLCLIGDTRVKTDKGYSYIKDIQVGDTVYSYDNRVDKLVETQVTNKWLTGVKQTYKVKSKHHSVVGTDTHPILVYDSTTNDVKYVPIKDLEPKRHCLTYISQEENAINKIFIEFNNRQEIPENLFVSSNEVKLNYIGKVLDSYGIQMDTIDGFSWKISSDNKKFIEDIKEIITSIGVASSNINKQNEDYQLYIGEYKLPKFEKIESVEEVDIEKVYDIEVAHEKHNFVANGIIVHNSRAPERRIFYIDVGNLPKIKAEQYLRDVMMRYRNKLTYDASTGEITDTKKFMSMLEDFWLPRREGGRGTEITTLPGGQNLGEITDIEYFKKKLYRSLNVPPSRMEGEGGFNLGRSSEILRDEVKFSKFVARLRKRFSYMFHDMLRTQLLLKNIVTPEDWDIMSEHIQYDFLYDNHFAELKDSELLNERLNMVQVAEPYVGKYFSKDYVRRKILRQTDQEILEQDAIIKKEIENGEIPDPNAPIDPETGMPLPQGTSQMDLGQPVTEPDLEGSKNAGLTKPSAKAAELDTSTVKMPKGGEI
jgi:intein/homing endonuclease